MEACSLLAVYAYKKIMFWSKTMYEKLSVRSYISYLSDPKLSSDLYLRNTHISLSAIFVRKCPYLWLMLAVKKNKKSDIWRSA
jgi:hypothetical protein